MPVRTSVVAYVCIALVGVALAATGVLEFADRAIVDTQFRVLRTWLPRPAPRDVVVVAIDEESVKRLPEPLSLWHSHFGKFLKATAAGGAAVVGLDVVLPGRSYDAIAPGSDKALLQGIITARRAAPLVLGRTIDPERNPLPIHPLFLAAAGNDGVAYVLLPADPDGAVRRFDERLGQDGGTVPTLAGEMARKLGASPRAGIIDYSRGAEFTYVPLHTVLDAFDGGNTAALEQTFKGKPVLLGAIFKFEDRLRAPVQMLANDSEAAPPGVIVHAQALRNLIGDGLIHSAPLWLVIALCAPAAAAWFVARSALLAVTVGVVGAAGILIASTAALAGSSHLPAAPALATLFVAVAARTTRDTAVAMRERRKMRQAFGGYVSPSVMDELMSGQLNAELGGVNTFVCALFSDIRGYTTRSETMTPHELVAFLNDYFEQVVEVIHAHGGTVVSFMGDGIMAIFGAPKALPNPCANAYEASKGLLEYVKAFNARARDKDEPPIDVGVGLHAGDAVVGHVGSSSRNNYTAIGDVINVASRLEGATKDVGYRLVYSKDVAEKLDGVGAAAHIGFQKIKGHTPVEVYGYDKIHADKEVVRAEA
jgi:class 3 adenylate cyclase